ncbi:Hpt domain-containing protein [Flagellimonas sp. HMM57]|uniref:Hpt domain-containing protein n=1 Tax=unclassified Flagellimonas TaxID=2644544 RepID=UPI0013D6340C|nr:MULTISPECIES: Hpt domain-containing protein [unclassified Flagellimonas]MBS9460958.1 Hpt domain-containing protein [Flagellimonas sp. 389]UII77109.1 Hpt domain-containing protein [Flagellimonas sp. HMM57]
MTEQPNLDYIKEISGGNEEFEKKFLTIIQTEFPKEKQEYLDFLKVDNLEESAKIIHKIKHKLGILGLNTSYRLAVKYEEDLKRGDIQLKEEFDEVLQVVEDFVLKLA